MYHLHSDIKTPADDLVIWRYMSVDKYISLLQTSALHMCRLDGFDDPWEGYWPVGYREFISDDMDIKSKAYLFVNCWHANNYESAAMWDLYGSRHSGVAIKTTVGSLKRSIIDEEDFYIGAVQYVDYDHYVERSMLNIAVPAFIKRQSFLHEQEVRLLSFGFPAIGADGKCSDTRLQAMSCKVDLADLMAEIYFSPTMPSWLVTALTDVSEKYGLTDCFNQSNLYGRLVK